MAADSQKMVILITRGLDDERSSVAWSVANGAVATGFEVTVFLASAGSTGPARARPIHRTSIP